MADQPKKPGSRERVRAFLHERGLSEAICEFDQSTKTAAMAAEAMGCDLGQIVKSLVVVVDDVRPVLALVAGDRRGDLDAIAREAGGQAARMANAEEVRQATGYAIGGVCPFGLPETLTVLVDDSLLRFETVFPAAGTPSSMVRMDRDSLVAMTAGRVALISH